jgi:hypothetical protein
MFFSRAVGSHQVWKRGENMVREISEFYFHLKVRELFSIKY